MPNAIAMLKADHTKVKQLLRRLNETGGIKEREHLCGEIEREIKMHSQLEEEIFYPAFRDAVRTKDDKKMYFEAKEEHHVVKLVLPEVKEGGMAVEEFAAKCKVLKELVEHHADEEEKDMFPEARKALSRAELLELGDQLAARKKELGA